MTNRQLVIAVGIVLALLAGRQAIGQGDETAAMTFFISSQGPGNGADLGGLPGGDAHCQTLAAAVGTGERVWRAYLSTAQRSEGNPVHARDRIGTGPWFNAAGVKVAENVEELHGHNNLTKETALDEHGQTVNGRGDSPNRHDIITGSQLDGTAFPEGEELTCDNWISSGGGSAQLGHHDRQGGGADPTSWKFRSRFAGLQPERATEHRGGRPVLLLRGRFANGRQGDLMGIAKAALTRDRDLISLAT